MKLESELIVELTNKLNLMYGSFLREDHTPFDANGISGVTKAKNTEGAFMLQSPDKFLKSGFEVNISPDFDQIVARAFIPYSAAIQISDNYSQGVFLLSLIKNDMLLSVVKEITSDFDKPTFQRPGQPALYFRELENLAGVELRCFAARKPAVIDENL